MLEEVLELLPKVWPLIALQLIVQIIALVSLIRRKSVRFNNKWIWGIIIVLTGILGSIAYFAFRGEEDADSCED